VKKVEPSTKRCNRRGWERGRGGFRLLMVRLEGGGGQIEDSLWSVQERMQGSEEREG